MEKLTDKQRQEFLNIAKGDYTSAKISQDIATDRIDKERKVIDSAKYGTEVGGKSQYVSGMTRKLLNWQIPSIIDVFTSNPDLVTCKPVTHLDTPLSEQEQGVLSHQLVAVGGFYTFITDLVTQVCEEGTAFVKAGWCEETKEVEIEQPIIVLDPITQEPTQVGTEVVKQTVVVKNMPTKQIVKANALKTSPLYNGSFEDVAFVIHSWDTSLSELKKDGRYSNLDEVAKFIKDTSDEDDYLNEDSDFKFEDSARTKFKVHEYWGQYDLNGDGITEPIVGAWVGDILIRLEDNPFPEQEIPFTRAVYKRIPNSAYGEGLASSTSKEQHIDSVLHRGIFDNMKLANNGQTGVKKGFTDEANLKRMKKGEDFEYNTTMNDVYEDSYNPINNSVFTLLGSNQSSAEGGVGVSLMNHGSGGNALGSSATAVTATMTSSAKREMHIVRGISEECLIPLLRKFSSYNREFLSPEEVMRITDEEYVQADKLSAFDIKMTLESAETRASKVQSTGFVLQTIAPNLPEEAQKILLARYLELVGEHDVAKILSIPVEPNEQQIKLQQLEVALQEAKLYNEQAKGQENAVDVQLKTAKTAVEQAKARTLGSEADLRDLDYLTREGGLDHERELEKIERPKPKSI